MTSQSGRRGVCLDAAFCFDGVLGVQRVTACQLLCRGIENVCNYRHRCGVRLHSGGLSDGARQPEVLMQPAELVIIGGAAVGTVLVANPLHILKKIAAGM